MGRCTVIGLMVWLVVAAVGRAAEQEMEFVGATELTLRGTLVLPDAPTGRVPVVLLLAGSGPTDRNGNPPGVKIDLLSSLADALRAVGVASFRYDKRAHASSLSGRRMKRTLVLGLALAGGGRFDGGRGASGRPSVVETAVASVAAPAVVADAGGVGGVAGGDGVDDGQPRGGAGGRGGGFAAV